MNRCEGGFNLDLQERLTANMSKSYQELYDRDINVERKRSCERKCMRVEKEKLNLMIATPTTTSTKSRTRDIQEIIRSKLLNVTIEEDKATWQMNVVKEVVGFIDVVNQVM